MITKQKILVVDDDTNVLEVLEARLSSAGFTVIKANSADKALDVIHSEKVALVISDMKMPNKGGMDLFDEIQTIDPHLPVLFLTAYGTIPDAVRAVKAGAVDYLVKPFDGRELVQKLKVIIDKKIGAPDTPKPSTDQNDFLTPTKNPGMKDLYHLINKVAGSDVNLLILGESGTGKEYVARGIHRLSSRRKHPFIVVDCGSTPTGLLESELFGHVKGSFTHAINDKKGLIEAADQGTLFLDEIGNISPEMQTRLLRFLEDYKIRRIGELTKTSVDCRIISATNSNLEEDIKEGKFREDLYYRLRVVTIKMPPLRERKEDIPDLALTFIDSFTKKNDMRPIDLSQKTIEWLCEYPWPGNIRELKNALEAGAVFCRNDRLTIKDLHLTGLPDIARPAATPSDTLSLEENEKNTIVRALEQSHGVQKKAADLLGISRRSIHYKIKKYEIDVAKYQI